MLRLLRFGILVVLSLCIIALVVATGRPETGAIEDAVLVAVIVALFALAIPVRRIRHTA